MKYPKLFTSLIAAAVLCTPDFTVPAAMPASANSIDPASLQYASEFYAIPEGMLLSMPPEKSEALLTLTNLELKRKRRWSRIDDNLSETYYIEFLRDSQGYLFASQKEEADYMTMKAAEDESASADSSSSSGWLQVTMAIADIDLLYEQLSFSCKWLAKPDICDFEESITFSWENGYFTADSTDDVYSTYGYNEDDEWHIDEFPFLEDFYALDDIRTVSFSRESTKKNIRRGEETMFAAVKVRKNYVAELEQLSFNYEILPKGTLLNLRTSVSRSQTPLRTLGQQIKTLFGSKKKDEAASWNGIIKRNYTNGRSESYEESRREKFIYNTYKIILDREPEIEDLTNLSMKIKTATMGFTDMRRYERTEKYGAKMTTAEFITMLFTSDEFHRRSLSTEALIATILAATGQSGYGVFSKDEWLSKFKDGMTVQDALSICYDTYDYMIYCGRWDVFCPR